MNPDSSHREDVEALVGDYLRRQESLVDAERILVEVQGDGATQRVDLRRDQPVYVGAGGALCALVFPTVYVSQDAKSQIPHDRATIIVARMQ